MNSSFDENNEPINTDPIENSTTNNESTHTEIVPSEITTETPDKTSQSSSKKTTEKCYTDEEKQIADKNAILAFLLFFAGPVLEYIFTTTVPILKNLVLVGDLISMALFFTPLLAIVLLAYNKHKYPWHRLSSVLMVILIILVIVFFCFLFLAILLMVVLFGATLECCSILVSVD